MVVMHNAQRISDLRQLSLYWEDIARSDLTAPETRRMAKKAVRDAHKEIAKLLKEEMQEIGEA